MTFAITATTTMLGLGKSTAQMRALQADHVATGNATRMGVAVHHRPAITVAAMGEEILGEAVIHVGTLASFYAEVAQARSYLDTLQVFFPMRTRRQECSPRYSWS